MAWSKFLSLHITKNKKILVQQPSGWGKMREMLVVGLIHSLVFNKSSQIVMVYPNAGLLKRDEEIGLKAFKFLK